MFERFLPTARTVVEMAHTEAHRLNRREVRAEHLLLALAVTQTGIASHVLADNGITADRIETALGTSIALDLDPRPLTRADAEALSTIGIDLDQIRPHLEGVGAGAVPSGSAGVKRAGRMRLSSEAKRVLAAAVTCAQRSDQGYVGAEHLLVGILTDNRSLAVELLVALDADPKELKIQTLNELKRVS